MLFQAIMATTTTDQASGHLISGVSNGSSRSQGEIIVGVGGRAPFNYKIEEAKNPQVNLFNLFVDAG